MNPHIGIVVSRFNEEITSRLLKNCLRTLKSKGIAQSCLHIVHVPGGYEIPWAVQELSLKGKCQVIIALGAIIKGSTPQNNHISRSTIHHLHAISLKTRIPCILGIITPNTHAQAMARTKGSLDRGRESALAALGIIEARRRLAKMEDR